MGVKQQTGQPSDVSNRDLRSAEEAAVWLQRLRAEDSPEVHAEFSAWVREGAKNLEEFLFAQALWKEMDQVDAGMRERLWSAESPSSVIHFPGAEALASERAPQLPHRGHRTWFGAAAAAVLCILVGVSWWVANRNTYVTAVGEQMTVKLPDGSLMHLNTDSRAVVSYSDTERAIRLKSGEALFTVAKNPSRPFYVLTASARIRAVGTEFNVRSNGTATHVSVVEGTVQVSNTNALPSGDVASGTKTVADLQLRAGDEAQVERKQIVKTPEPNIERAVSWRARRLMFPGNPVGEIAEEFNRYNKTTIRIEGAQLRTRRMSGVFDADDPSPLLQFLERDPTVEVIKSDDEIVIRGH